MRLRRPPPHLLAAAPFQSQRALTDVSAARAAQKARLDCVATVDRCVNLAVRGGHS